MTRLIIHIAKAYGHLGNIRLAASDLSAHRAGTSCLRVSDRPAVLRRAEDGYWASLLLLQRDC